MEQYNILQLTFDLALTHHYEETKFHSQEELNTSKYTLLCPSKFGASG